MSTIELRDGGLAQRLTWWERLVSLRAGDVEVGAAQILRAASVRNPWDELRGLRMPGLGVPGMSAVGAWRRWTEGRSGRDFVVVRGRGPGVVVHLAGHEFARLVLSVDNPSEVLIGLRCRRA